MRAISSMRPVCASLLLVLAGCASTSLEATWTRPEFAGQHLEGPVMVVALARDETVRRTYEDDMSQKLAARGITALRSYEKVPGALQKDANDRLLAAARDAKARYMLSTALIGQDVEQVVTQEPMGYVSGGYGGWYGSAWGYAYTEVRTYKVYIAQTALTEVASDRVEWTARTRTTEPSNIDRDTRAFVDVILGALDAGKLIGSAK
jgi:hypothetical protein